MLLTKDGISVTLVNPKTIAKYKRLGYREGGTIKPVLSNVPKDKDKKESEVKDGAA